LKVKRNQEHNDAVYSEKSYVVLTLLGDPGKGNESSSEVTGTTQPSQSGDAAASQQLTKVSLT